MYRTYEIVTLGDKITHPLGRFSKQGFLDNGEGVLSTTTNDASICAILLDGILIFPEPSFSVFACPLPPHVLEENGSDLRPEGGCYLITQRDTVRTGILHVEGARNGLRFRLCCVLFSQETGERAIG